MTHENPVSRRRLVLSNLAKRVLIFVSVFGPATITAMEIRHASDGGGVTRANPARAMPGAATCPALGT